jgi:hypothetical protein
VTRPSPWLLIAVLVVGQLVPADSCAEPRGLCLRACRKGISACVAWHMPTKRRRARRICARELLPSCISEGVIECQRAPHYRGSYAFEGELADTTCDALPAGVPATATMWFTVHNRSRDWLDATIYGDEVDESSGQGAEWPWTVGNERAPCLYASQRGDWCAGAKLSVYGPPPRSPESPRPRATLISVLTVVRPAPGECTLTYEGELAPVPPIE